MLYILFFIVYNIIMFLQNCIVVNISVVQLCISDRKLQIMGITHLAQSSNVIKITYYLPKFTFRSSTAELRGWVSLFLTQSLSISGSIVDRETLRSFSTSSLFLLKTFSFQCSNSRKSYFTQIRCCKGDQSFCGEIGQLRIFRTQRYPKYLHGLSTKLLFQ